MGKMTAGQVLTQVDSLLPNAYTREEKLRWLLQAEGTLIREVLRPVDRETSVPEKLEESTVLVAETPYDGLYDLYVQAQIHYADGDMAHWNNAMALWNRGVEALQAETLRKWAKCRRQTACVFAEGRRGHVLSDAKENWIGKDDGDGFPGP